MANPKHVEILREGKMSWDFTRGQRPNVVPDLSGADLRSVDLTEMNLSSANLTGANLAGANLTGANLAGANLSSANLAGANLSFADCSGANLNNASLNGANLCLSIGLTQEQIAGAKVDKTTTLPKYLDF